MRPWHELVCGSNSGSLPDAGIAFINRFRQSTPSQSTGAMKRPIPDYVRRLIGIGEVRHVDIETSYRDHTFWAEAAEIADDIAGLAVFLDFND